MPEKSTNEKYFYCKPCRFVFQTEDYVTIGDDVFSKCPICGKDAQETSWRVANLALGWDKATGPKTPEGKARVRLNGFKHGRRAQFHILAPAKPGKFPMCENCEEIEACKAEYKYCPRYLDMLARFVQAYEEGNVNDLRQVAGLRQAQIDMVFQMMIQHILKNGVMFAHKKPMLDGEGQPIYDENGKLIFNIDWVKNNLVKELPGYANVLGFDATSQEMTPRVRQEADAIKGFIDGEKENRETITEIRKRHFEEMKRMREAINKLTAKKAIEKFEKAREDEQSANQSGESGRERDSEI